jgi:citrate synthase
MMNDLVGKKSYFQVLVLNAIGRLPEKRLADWLEALFMCLSWPDARIWCNQVGSLAGSARTSPVAGVCAGILASDSKMYGPGTQIMGVTFITKALRKKEEGLTPEMIIEQYPNRNPGKAPTIHGYVRPVASGDERVAAMERVTTDLGYKPGPHLLLAKEIEAVMLRQFNEGINLLGYCAAFLSDQGFDAIEQYRLVSTMVNSGVHACYAEAADLPAGSFFPLHCADIDYQGHAPRPVPDKD